jgi:hypothetical protein
MIQDPMPVIPEEEYRRRWEAVLDLMERQDLDITSEPPRKVGIAGSALMSGEVLARFRK